MTDNDRKPFMVVNNKDKNSASKMACVAVALIILGLCFIKACVSAESNRTEDSLTYDATTALDSNNSQKRMTGSSSVRLDETVKIDHGDVTFSFTEVSKDLNLNYIVLNDGNADINYAIDSVAVNGCQVYDNMAFSKVVTAGNKSIDSFDISGAKAYGIRSIETIDVAMTLYIENEIYRKKVHLAIVNDSGKEFVPEFASAELAYEDDNFALFVVKMGDSLDKFEFLLQNKSETDIEVNLINVAVNGIMSDNMGLYFTVIPKGYAYTKAYANNAITIYDPLEEEIKEKGFNNVTSISGELRVWLTSDDKTDDFYDVKNVEIYLAN